MISIRVFRKCTASIICTFGSILQHKIVNYCLRNHFLTRDQCFRQIQLTKSIFFVRFFLDATESDLTHTHYWLSCPRWRQRADSLLFETMNYLLLKFIDVNRANEFVIYLFVA